MTAESEIVEGYRDGFSSDLTDVPPGSNRSRLYRLGWMNGRDDRLGIPRQSAEATRAELREIEAEEALR